MKKLIPIGIMIYINGIFVFKILLILPIKKSVISNRYLKGTALHITTGIKLKILFGDGYHGGLLARKKQMN